MRDQIFKASVALVALVFIIIFIVLVIPPLIEKPDIIGAFGAGFVNNYSSAYSADVICCWVILFVWVVYEYPKVKHGWVCLLLGLVPGVAVGLTLYLILRMRQVTNKATIV